MIAKADALRIPLAERSCDLVVGSPPYLNARLYLEGGVDLGIARDCRAWVDWMVDVTAEALRVSRGLVLWVVAGKTEDWCYQPGPEGLLWEWWKWGGESHLFRPCYWHRDGIPGSGSDQWFRSDIEYVLAFKRPGRLPYGDPKANGHPPKWAPGGAMSHRLTNGERVNQWGRPSKNGSGREPNGVHKSSSRPSHVAHTKRLASGAMAEQHYAPPAVANPGNLIHTGTGGGNLGHALAHESEAPYPVEVPAFFIRSHCPPGGLVLDPFSGSGTTLHAARQEGRRGIGFDLRMSQCKLARRRLATVTPGFSFTFDNPPPPEPEPLETT